MTVSLSFVKNNGVREVLTNFEDQLSSWRQSKNGSEYCYYIDLQESIRSQLQQEDKFTKTIAGSRYTVKNYDGKWLVFRRDLAANMKKSYDQISSVNVIEVKVFTLDEANMQLCNSQNSFELFGSDPVKVVHDKIKVVMARRTGSTSSLNGEDNNDQ